jgi:pimeloyl-ACP methyl ester carboxylesterase
MTRPTLLMLPGNMCDARLWDGVSDLATEFVNLSQDDSIENMAARALADHHGVLILIGFSMGGIVALDMARQAPQRIMGLVLSDTNAGADLPERAAARPLQQARVRAGKLAQIVTDELKPAYLAVQNRNNQSLKSLLFEMAMALGDDVFVLQSEALRTRNDLGPVLDCFAGPILFLCGAEDALCPPEWHQVMASRSRDAELQIIEGAGHLLPLEQPEAFRAAVIDWLNRKFG